MKRDYLLGLATVVFVALATLTVKSLVSRYPGVGDFWLLDGVGELLPRRLEVDGRLVLWLAKIVGAAALFTGLFFALARIGDRRLLVALGLSTLTLVGMSLGDVVLG
jgi:hypothetical protein